MPNSEEKIILYLQMGMTLYVQVRSKDSGVRIVNFAMSTNLAVKINKGAARSLARPGRKQATATEDFDFHISYL